MSACFLETMQIGRQLVGGTVREKPGAFFAIRRHQYEIAKEESSTSCVNEGPMNNSGDIYGARWATTMFHRHVFLSILGHNEGSEIAKVLFP